MSTRTEPRIGVPLSGQVAPPQSTSAPFESPSFSTEPSVVAFAPTRLPSLDGWRAVSILLVLGSHTRLAPGFPDRWQTPATWLFDGNLGVRFFFLISGFLITWLMLAEWQRVGRVALSKFYARRALRILPVYIAFLLVLFALQSFSPFHQSRAAWVSNLTFTTNFVGQSEASNHLWSLGVEEQFYLLWPCLFLLLRGGRRRRATAWLLAIPIIVAPFCRVIGYTNFAPPAARWAFQAWSFLDNFDSLAVGCACAIIFAEWPQMLRFYLKTRAAFATAGALGLILIPYALNHLFLAGIFTVPLADSCEALGFGILLLQSIGEPQRGVYRVLNWRVMREIGILSYSIYIWQQLFWMTPSILGTSPVWWMSFRAWLLPTFVVATVSYYALERPLFSLRARLTMTAR